MPAPGPGRHGGRVRSQREGGHGATGDASSPLGGDLTFEIGTGVLQTAQGPQEAKCVVIWKRDAHGQWKWHVDMWNDAPQG